MTAAKKSEPKPEPVEVEAVPVVAPKPEPAPEPELIEVSLPDGTKVSTYADARDDFEVLDEVARLEDGDLSRLPALMRRLMPEKDRRAALETVRDPKTGRVPIDAASNLLWDIFAGMRNPN